MRYRSIALAGVAVLATALPAAARDVPQITVAPEAEAAPEDEQEILVTARNRTERVGDVPIPISVVNAATIAQQRVFTLADLTQRSPGLTATTPNARRTGVSLRGIGKTSGNDNMEAAVGVRVRASRTRRDHCSRTLRAPRGAAADRHVPGALSPSYRKAPATQPDGQSHWGGSRSRGPTCAIAGLYAHRRQGG